MKMDSNNTGDVSRAEFMEYMLLEARFLDPEVLIEVNEAFDRLAHLGGKSNVQLAPRPVLNLHQIVVAKRNGANLNLPGDA